MKQNEKGGTGVDCSFCVHHERVTLCSQWLFELHTCKDKWSSKMEMEITKTGRE